MNYKRKEKNSVNKVKILKTEKNIFKRTLFHRVISCGLVMTLLLLQTVH